MAKGSSDIGKVEAGWVKAPILKAISCSWKGCVLEPRAAAVCSPGRRRKKKPKMARSAIAQEVGVEAESRRCCIIVIGMGFTREAGESSRA